MTIQKIISTGKTAAALMTMLLFAAFVSTSAFAQTDWNNDPGAPWNSHTAEDYNRQNQMQEEQARQQQQIQQQREEIERQQQQMQQQQYQFNNMTPAERMTYGHL